MFRNEKQETSIEAEIPTDLGLSDGGVKLSDFARINKSIGYQFALIKSAFDAERSPSMTHAAGSVAQICKLLLGCYFFRSLNRHRDAEDLNGRGKEANLHINLCGSSNQPERWTERSPVGLNREAKIDVRDQPDSSSWGRI